MKIGAITLGLLVLGATGCASQQSHHWEKEGGGDFSADSYACERDTRQSGYFGGGLIGSANMLGFYNRCLTSKGWYLATDKRVKEFSASDWDGVRQACMVDAKDTSRLTGVSFPNAFDICMKSRGF